MYQLPPIKHSGLARLERHRNSAARDESSGQHTDSFRRQSEPTMGKPKAMDIQITREDDGTEIFDLGYSSVREAMGSPVPRSLADDAYLFDKSFLEPHHGGHPKITIDICGDTQMGQHLKPGSRDPGLGAGFGQPITRSLSANNLLLAPSPVMTRHRRLQATQSWSTGYQSPGTKVGLSVGMCRSEGNIPLIFDQERAGAQCSSIRNPVKPYREPHTNIDARLNLTNVRRRSAERPVQCSGDKDSLNRCTTTTTTSTEVELDDRPNSPVPERLAQKTSGWGSNAPVMSPLIVSVTPPISPHLTPHASPGSHSMMSLTPPRSPEWLQTASSNPPGLRMQVTPPVSPLRNPPKVPHSPGPSPRGSPRRLLPLRSDRQEV